MILSMHFLNLCWTISLWLLLNGYANWQILMPILMRRAMRRAMRLLLLRLLLLRLLLLMMMLLLLMLLLLLVVVVVLKRKNTSADDGDDGDWTLIADRGIYSVWLPELMVSMLAKKVIDTTDPHNLSIWKQVTKDRHQMYGGTGCPLQTCYFGFISIFSMLCFKHTGSITIRCKPCKLSETLWGTRCMWLVGLSRCCSLRLGWFWSLPWNERLGMLSCKLSRHHRSQLLWPGSKGVGSLGDLAAQRKVKSMDLIYVSSWNKMPKSISEFVGRTSRLQTESLQYIVSGCRGTQ